MNDRIHLANEGGFEMDHPVRSLAGVRERLGERPVDGWRCAGFLDDDRGRSRTLVYVTEGNGTVAIERADDEDCVVTIDNGSATSSEIWVDWDAVWEIADLMDVYLLGRRE